MFLSHPPIVTSPSNPSAPATVSIESAITSLDMSEYFIPGVPIDIPSDTVMVLKIIDLPPLVLTPLEATSANLLICILHGVTMAQVEAIPIIGLLKSGFLNPTALSIALLGALSRPSVTMDENFLFFILF